MQQGIKLSFGLKKVYSSIFVMCQRETTSYLSWPLQNFNSFMHCNKKCTNISFNDSIKRKQLQIKSKSVFNSYKTRKRILTGRIKRMFLLIPEKYECPSYLGPTIGGNSFFFSLTTCQPTNFIFSTLFSLI